MIGRWLAMTTMTAVLAACGSSAGGGVAAGGGASCVANDSKQCFCDDGSTGFQTCAEDGAKYSKCKCNSGVQFDGGAGQPAIDAATTQPGADGGSTVGPEDDTGTGTATGSDGGTSQADTGGGSTIPEAKHPATVIRLARTAKNETCFDSGVVKPTCCPDGYEAKGIYVDAGAFDAVCVEKANTDKTIVHLSYDMTGESCMNLANQWETKKITDKCCPPGFEPTGTYIQSGELKLMGGICRDKTRSGRAVVYQRYGADGSACVDDKSKIAVPSCCPKGFTTVGVLDDGGSLNAVCLETQAAGGAYPAAKTVFSMQIRADHTSCVEKHKPYSKCCPAGFSPVGTFTDHGEDNTVCLDNGRSNRAVIKLKYDAKGMACIAANTISATCCPDGYKAVGVYSDAATHNIVCLETKGSGRSWYQIAFPPDMSANCNSSKCCPKGYSYVGFYADGKQGYQNGTCLQDP